MGRRDELVGVRLDPDRDPDEALGRDSRVGRQRSHPRDLLERIQHEPPDPQFEGARDLGLALVVAVEQDVGARDPRPHRDLQFTAGTDVDAHTFCLQPLGHRGGQERLAGVVHGGVGPRGCVSVGVTAGGGTHVALIQHHHRGLGLAHDIGDRHAADGHDAVLPPSGSRGPDIGVEVEQLRGIQRARRSAVDIDDVAVARSGGVSRHGAQDMGYIRSGALTPSRSSPLAIT